MTNEELAELVRAGDHDAVLQLWQQVELFVKREANRMARRIPASFGVDAEDLIQSCFFSMLEACTTFDAEKGSFVGWLKYYLKKEYRRIYTDRDPVNYGISLETPLDGEDPDAGTMQDIIPDPAGEAPYNAIREEAWNEYAHAVLDRYIDTLPEGNAAAVRAKWFDGKQLKEFAEELGEDPKKVMARYDRGMKQLRRRDVVIPLMRELDLETNFFQHVSIDQFTATGESAVEKIVFAREEKRRRQLEHIRNKYAAKRR